MFKIFFLKFCFAKCGNCFVVYVFLFLGKTSFLSGRLKFKFLHFIGLVCCAKSASSVLGISYSSLCQHAKAIAHEDEFAPALHDIRLRKARPKMQKDSVVIFLQNSFDSIQQHMPNSLLKTLPSTFTKYSLYQEYKQNRKNLDSLVVASWKYFLILWKRHFPMVKAYNYKEGFGRCSLCVSLQTMRENARSEEQQGNNVLWNMSMLACIRMHALVVGRSFHPHIARRPPERSLRCPGAI